MLLDLASLSTIATYSARPVALESRDNGQPARPIGV